MPELSFDVPDLVLWQTAALSVLVAYLLSQAIAGVYVWSHRGVSYSRSLVVTLVATWASHRTLLSMLRHGRRSTRERISRRGNCFANNRR